MTRQEALNKIREACVKANPEIVVYDCGSPCHCHTRNEREIRLADVLLAIDGENELNPISVTSEGQFFQYDPEEGAIQLSRKYWTLRKDSLTDQSDECLEFLASII